MKRVALLRRGFAASLLAGSLTSCGGGGGSGTPPAANNAPVFTSGASAAVVENTAQVFYSATASDADGDSLSYSISGGPDAARFTISTSGALQFTTAPNFDLPRDANGDNVYQITLGVSDGRASAGNASQHDAAALLALHLA